MAIVGTAYVEIRSLGNKLEKDIKKQLESAGISAGKTGGDETSKNFVNNVDNGIRNNISGVISKPMISESKKAGKEAGSLGGEEYVKSLTNKVDGLISGKLSEPIKKEVVKGAEQGASEAATIINETLEREIGGGGGGAGGGGRSGGAFGNAFGRAAGRGIESSRFTRVLASAAVKLGALIPIVGGLVAGVSSLVSGLVAISAPILNGAASMMSFVGVLGAGIQAIGVMMIGFQGVGKAISTGMDPTKAKEFAKAMKGLSPEARGFVKELISMKDGFKEIKDSAARGMFPGFTEALKSFQPLLPSIARGFEAAGKAVGDMVSNVSKILTAETFLGNFGDVAKSNNKVIGNLGAGLGNLVRVFVALLDAASPITEALGEWFEGWTDGLRRTTEAANSSGGLTQYFVDAAENGKLVVRIFKNVFMALGDIGKVAKPMGESLLGSLEKVTEGWATFTDDAKNVEWLKDYFEGVGVNVRAIGDLVRALGRALGRMGADPGVAKLSKSIEAIVPILEEALVAGLDTVAVQVVELVGIIGELFTAMENSGAIQAFMNVFISLGKAVTAVLEIPGFGKMAGTILAIVGALKAMSLIGKMSGLTSFVGGIREGNGVLGAFHTNMKKTRELTEQEAAMFARHGKRVGAVPIGIRAAFRETRKEFTRGHAAMGLMAVAASGVADKVGLSGATMGASIGMIGGAWGAAAGAAIGFGFDAVKAANATSDAIKNMDKAIESADMGQLTSSIADANAQVDKLKDMQQITGVGDAIGDFGNNLTWAVGNAFKGNWTGTAQDDIDAITEKLKLAKEEQQRLNWESQGFSPAIAAERAKKAFSDLADDIKKNKIKSSDLFDPSEDYGAKFLEQIDHSYATLRNKFGDGKGSGTKIVATLVPQMEAAGVDTQIATIVARARAGFDKNKILEGINLGTIPQDQLVGLLKNFPEAAGAEGEKARQLIIQKMQFNAGEFPTQLDIPVGLEDNFTQSYQHLNGLEPAGKRLPIVATGQESVWQILTTIDEKNLAGKDIDVEVMGPAEQQLATMQAYGFNTKPVDTKIGKNDAKKELDKIKKDKAQPQKGTAVIDTTKATANLNAFNRKKLKDKDATFNIKTFVGGSWKKLLNAMGFAKGGWVSGPGTATSDSIPALLSNGEFVVKAAQAAKFGPILEAMNEGKNVQAALPQAPGVDSAMPVPTPSGKRGPQQIYGRLVLENGEAYIAGISQETIDQNDRFNNW